MKENVTEIYRPRGVVDLGLWDVAPLKLKIYGIAAAGRELTDAMIRDARSFVSSELPARVAAEGEDNGLGFVIIHPGDLGISVSAHWWIQGCVLCQHIQRRLWDSEQPMKTAERPVIGCVWELGLINAEQEAWRESMMKADPDPAAYLKARAGAVSE